MADPQKTNVPYVPKNDPMFEDHAGADGKPDGQPWTWKLTRTWMIFFERWGRTDSQIINNNGGGNETQPYTITAGIGIGGDIVVANDVCPPFEVRVPGAAVDVVANCKVAPVGADLIIDILANLSSIFGATKLVIADGTTRGTQTVFVTDPFALALEDKITVNALQVGSGTPGRDLTFEIKVLADVD